MTLLEFSAVFGLGLASSLHCVQMCGPIVLSYSLPLARGRGMLAAHAAYNAGRILTYCALGAIAGAAGGAVGFVAGLAGIANGARIFAGAAMIVAAVFMSGLAPGSGLVQIGTPRGAGRLILSPRARSKFGLGLILGFLPCGLVYAALLKSLDAGSASAGALTMLAFGLGTAVALIGMGLVSSAAGRRLGRWSNAIAAASIALMGAFLIWRGMLPGGAHGHHG